MRTLPQHLLWCGFVASPLWSIEIVFSAADVTIQQNEFGSILTLWNSLLTAADNHLLMRKLTLFGRLHFYDVMLRCKYERRDQLAHPDQLGLAHAPDASGSLHCHPLSEIWWGTADSVLIAIDPQQFIRLGLRIHMLTQPNALVGFYLCRLLMPQWVSEWRTVCHHVMPYGLADQWFSCTQLGAQACIVFVPLALVRL